MFLKYQTVHQNGLGTQPFPDGACDRTGLSSSAFQHALAFAKRMNRALTAGDCAKCENNGDSLNRLGTVPFSNAIMSFIMLEKGIFLETFFIYIKFNAWPIQHQSQAIPAASFPCVTRGGFPLLPLNHRSLRLGLNRESQRRYTSMF